MRLWQLIAAILLMGTAISAASAQYYAQERMVEGRLVSDHRTVSPGSTFRLGFHQAIEPGWHTYWRNPGDSGDRIRFDLSLPETWQVSEVYWPLPGLFSLGPLRNYGYEDEVTLSVDVTVPADADSGPLLVRASATWLVCADICIPEQGEFELLLEVGPSQLDPEGARLIGSARAQVPVYDPSVDSGQ